MRCGSQGKQIILTSAAMVVTLSGIFTITTTMPINFGTRKSMKLRGELVHRSNRHLKIFGSIGATGSSTTGFRSGRFCEKYP